MRIYTRAGDLAFKLFTFPDGQPHFKLETYEREFDTVTIEARIGSPTELFQVLLANSVLRAQGYSSVCLDIRYLMGARMDRAIDSLQPFTLEVVSRLLNGAGFTKVRGLDVHSEVATRLIRNFENLLPYDVVRQVLNTVGPVDVLIPDKGANERVTSLCGETHSCLQCYKERDPQTGALTKFRIPRPKMEGGYLIVDDICDGGGTFVGLAKELKKAGARKIYLFVTHGVFSKGLPLDSIDHVYTTDSYQLREDILHRYIEWTVTTIPINMKDIK